MMLCLFLLCAAAVAAGQGAFLLEQKKPDIFQMSVGNLLPGQSVQIRVTYIQILEAERPGTYRFLLPTTVAPRYTPPPPASALPAAASEAKAKDSKQPAAATLLDYALTIEVELEMASEVRGAMCLVLVCFVPDPFFFCGVQLVSVVSPSHTLTTTLSGRSGHCALSGGGGSELDRDLVLLVTERAGASAQVVLERWAAPVWDDTFVQSTTMGVDPKLELIAGKGRQLVLC
jgi:hypothetical protein